MGIFNKKWYEEDDDDEVIVEEQVEKQTEEDIQEIKESLKYKKEKLLILKDRYDQDVNRQTGRTTKIINDFIDELFTQPVGTPIVLKDHYTGQGAGKYIMERFTKRMYNEFPHVNYKVSYGRTHDEILITRTSKTFQEDNNSECQELRDEIKELEDTIYKMDDSITG